MTEAPSSTRAEPSADCTWHSKRAHPGRATEMASRASLLLIASASLLLSARRAAAGACGAGDQAAINAKGGGDDDGHFPKITSDCGHKALNIFSGIDEDKFNTCLTGEVNISKGCSDCYWKAAEYGYKSCKVSCLRGWCSKACLDCAKGFDTVGCAGFDGPNPTPCSSSEGGEDEGEGEATVVV
eukprot:CAMPEP_0204512610 /NCGR_PEP_ID=MMETSP0661-20131031/1046_1 /ASSEMBLY_ACC=CAM_ASM_000606 /TAXON_ID=109239 /ORGANISM="Alexandrium margalefi, Strain AMGDE01CS-322" /LENGTH=183 /DNA_ID=CAMNT_0051517735 /DNA_START=28 /DNA_END=580 /DNA_ORIENTATION=+